MKNNIISIIMLMALYCQTLQAQKGGSGIGTTFNPNNLTQQQINDLMFPHINRTTTHIPCSPTVVHGNCNLITNSNFNTNVTPYDINDPFGLDQVPGWSQTHGTPILNAPFWGIQNPTTSVTNIAILQFGNLGGVNGTPAQDRSEGIITKIPPLQIGQQYFFRFFEFYPQYFSNLPAIEDVSMYLIKCSDYANFNINGNTPPPVPVNSQRIFCETNFASQPLIPLPIPWQNRGVNFTALDNYDMLWVRVVPKSNSINPPSLMYAFGLPELIKIDLTATISPSVSPSVCQYTLSVPMCNTPLYNTNVVWHGPNGQQMLGATINIDVNDPLQVGNWRAYYVVSNLNPSNTTCYPSTSSNLSITFPSSISVVSVPACNTTPTINCLSIPSIQ